MVWDRILYTLYVICITCMLICVGYCWEVSLVATAVIVIFGLLIFWMSRSQATLIHKGNIRFYISDRERPVRLCSNFYNF